MFPRIEELLKKYVAIYEELENCDNDNIRCTLHQINCECRSFHKKAQPHFYDLNNGKLIHAFYEQNARSLYYSFSKEDFRTTDDILLLFVIHFLVPLVIFESFNNNLSTENARIKVLDSLENEA